MLTTIWDTIMALWDVVWTFFSVWFGTSARFIGDTWSSMQSVFSNGWGIVSSVPDGMLSFGTAVAFIPLFPVLLLLALAMFVFGLGFMFLGVALIVPLFFPEFFEVAYDVMISGLDLFSVYNGLFWPLEISFDIMAWFASAAAWIAEVLMLPVDLVLLPFRMIFKILTEFL